jgi:hypothetical protein
VQRPGAGWLGAQGAAEKIKRENDAHLRQLAKKSTYVPWCLLFFYLFSRQGEFENTRKKITGEIVFGGNFFLGDFF